MKYVNYKEKTSGDTIVEVMISMAILAFALGGAYVLGNRALRTAVESNQRKEATAIAQGQIELLKNAYATKYAGAPAAFTSTYENSGADYCILSSQPLLAQTNPTTTGSPCQAYGSSQYSVVIHYDSTAANPSSNITIGWDNINGRGPTVNGRTNQSQLKSFYRLPN